MTALMENQDDCLIAIIDGRPIPDRALRSLPPWRAVMVARLGKRAGVEMESGSLEELVAEAVEIGGNGVLHAAMEER